VKIAKRNTIGHCGENDHSMEFEVKVKDGSIGTFR